jgi:hypothetical protein
MLVFVGTSINYLIEIVLPQMIAFISILIFIFTTNTPLLPEYVVLIIGNFYIIVSQFDEFNRGANDIVGGYVSCDRVQKYLMEAETVNFDEQNKMDSQPFVKIDNISASFSKVRRMLRIIVSIVCKKILI